MRRQYEITTSNRWIHFLTQLSTDSSWHRVKQLTRWSLFSPLLIIAIFILFCSHGVRSAIWSQYWIKIHDFESSSHCFPIVITLQHHHYQERISARIRQESSENRSSPKSRQKLSEIEEDRFDCFHHFVFGIRKTPIWMVLVARTSNLIPSHQHEQQRQRLPTKK